MRGRTRLAAAVFSALSMALVVGALGAAPALASDDSFFDQQWNLAQIKAESAWSSSTGAGVTIGIVDTGVDLGHPDLAGKVTASANCVGGTCRDGGANDAHGHGTILAGIAAAVTNNSRGIAGVAPDARLVVAKAIDDQGRGDAADIVNAIRWVVDHGARIVNLSLGDPNFLVTSLLGTPLRPGIDYAWSKGAIPVLASGNENVGLLDLGSSNYGTLNAVIVGASDKAGGIASYSSPIGNAKWGLVAPGGSGGGPGSDVLSTFTNGRYAWVAGTSMAAPHVSGALALLLSQRLSPETAIQRMLNTADKSVKCGGGCQGRLDVAAAVGLGPRVSPGSTAPAASAPPATTTQPATTVRPAATTTTTRPGATTTTAAPSTEPTTVPPASGGELAVGPSTAILEGEATRNSLVIVLAVALVGGVGSVATLVGWERFREAGG